MAEEANTKKKWKRNCNRMTSVGSVLKDNAERKDCKNSLDRLHERQHSTSLMIRSRDRNEKTQKMKMGRLRTERGGSSDADDGDDIEHDVVDDDVVDGYGGESSRTDPSN